MRERERETFSFVDLYGNGFGPSRVLLKVLTVVRTVRGTTRLILSMPVDLFQSPGPLLQERTEVSNHAHLGTVLHVETVPTIQPGNESGFVQSLERLPEVQIGRA